ncbi:hypothetical protein EBN03_10230 [Nocardia stercoris]|uniref:Uncharacterized protein n=1 Tax=Nocardia stercoris TaxID=2483361 RepID=A0A3M2L8W4_9NOCA|nr:hypothetical protein EBN03_10230 [Nocardia stercoris]
MATVVVLVVGVFLLLAVGTVYFAVSPHRTSDPAVFPATSPQAVSAVASPTVAPPAPTTQPQVCFPLEPC